MPRKILRFLALAAGWMVVMFREILKEEQI